MDETGYVELMQIYQAIERTGQTPLVLDSDDLQVRERLGS